MIYKLKSTRRPDFECEIETNADIVPIIREYRTHYKAASKGYHNKTGKRLDYKERWCYVDFVYGKSSEQDSYYKPDRFEAFNAYYQISPSERMSASETEYGFLGDIRRVLADIFYVLYILENNSENKIKRLKWKEKEYTNIGNVSEHIDKNGNVRIIFEAVNNNGDKEVVLLPIPLNNTRSFLMKYQSDFYILEDKGRRIEFAFSQQIPCEEIEDSLLEKTVKTYGSTVKNTTQDFFWGSNKDYKLGLFYMDGEELIPFYALTAGDELVTRYFGQEENKVELTDKEKNYFLELEKSNNLEEAAKMYQMIECMRKIPIKFTVDIDGITYSVKRYLDGLEIDLDEKTGLSCNKMELQITIEKDSFPIKWKILKDNHIIPETLYKTITDKEVVDWFEEVVKVFKEYIKENKGLDKLLELSNTEAEKEIAKVEKMLYPSPLVPDKGVAKIVYEEKQKYRETGKMPNFVIMGGPGCGKSTLVDNIAKYMTDVDSKELVLKKSTSDLKGAYVGQTANRVYALLEKAYNDKKIVFIDEAYNLQSDQFGKEALEMLLPLISGDRTDIECVETESQGKGTKSLKFENGVPGIWLAGYEQEMREMLVENPGLYRRMVKITLTEPTVEGLYSNLLDKVANDSSLRKHFNECEKEIKNYFGWASAKENIAYFGNYAGVEEFYRTCKVRLKGDRTINVKRCIREIIDEKKREIKKQYKAILAKNERKQKGETAKFEIQRDVSVVLDDVKGNDVAVSGMRQIVKMLMGREVYENGGINVPKGALLVGPPGTGKTMIARALAGEIQRSYDDSEKKEKSVAFISVLSTELNTPQKVSALFEEASEYDSSIIFIDELDAIGMRRELSSNPSILIQLMKEMDGFEERKNIFVMAATNAPESLDPALKRPGRFDRNIEVSYPNEEGRRAILQSYLEKLSDIKSGIEKLGEDKTLGDLAQEVAEKTVGFVPAELKNLVNEAAILHKEIEEPGNETIKYKHREGVTSQSVYERFRADILEALERIRIGELVEGSKEDCFQDTENTGSSAVAIHEVGHALVSVLLGIEPFEKITVISRGDALGYVSPSQKNSLRTKADFLKKIKVCLGGRVAEEIFYGEDISTGAVQDIQQATNYAENMVMLFGMSEKIGPMALKTYQTNYLGKGQSYRCSSEFACKAEEDINEILRAQLVETRGMLKNHKELISKLAKFVFDNETLTGSEFVKEYERIKSEL